MPATRALPRSLLPAVALAGALALALGMLLLLGPASAHAAPVATPVLTGHQQRVVLDLIDDACGDTWCEGDYRFDFRTFTCERPSRSCTLRLRISPYTDGPEHWYWRAGRVTGFVRFDQMVATSPTGTPSMTAGFRDAVDALVHRVETTVPGPGPPGTLERA